MFKPSLPRPLIGFLSGVLMGLTPAPVGAWFLAWVALAPLWVLLRAGLKPSTDRLPQLGKTKAWTLWLGPAVLWGIGYHGLALIWITHLHPLTWMGIPWLPSLAIALGCWLFITFWGAVMVTLWAGGMVYLWSRWLAKQGAAVGSTTPSRSHRYLARLAPYALILIGVAIWCGLEAIWSLGPLYWTSLSYTQSPHNLDILHLGRISGPYTITAVIVAVNGLLAEAWLAWTGSGRDRTVRSDFSMLSQRTVGWRSLLVSLVILLVGSHLLGWSLRQVPLSRAAADSLTVGMIQGNLVNEVKLEAAGLRLAQQRYTEGYEQLVNQGVDVVLTPEGAMPLLWTDRMQRSALYRAIAQQQVPLWLGTLQVKESAPPGEAVSHVTQSLITLMGNPAVDPYSRYNKIKLVPLGEYIPFESVLGSVINRLTSLDFNMVPGNDSQEFDTPWGQAAVGICYESAFGDWFRVQVARGAEFILTASNNDPYPRFMMMQHHAQDVMRAIETDRWAARATNTGLSAFVDPHGHTLWMSQSGQYTIHAETIYRRQSRTPYVRWGDWLTPLLLLSAIAVYFYWQWSTWRHQREP